jgi:hypothetical protein
VTAARLAPGMEDRRPSSCAFVAQPVAPAAGSAQQQRKWADATHRNKGGCWPTRTSLKEAAPVFDIAITAHPDLSRLIGQMYVHQPFVVSPSTGLRTGLSNHGRNVLKTVTLRLAQQVGR